MDFVRPSCQAFQGFVSRQLYQCRSCNTSIFEVDSMLIESIPVCHFHSNRWQRDASFLNYSQNWTISVNKNHHDNLSANAFREFLLRFLHKICIQENIGACICWHSITEPSTTNLEPSSANPNCDCHTVWYYFGILSIGLARSWTAPRGQTHKISRIDIHK